MLEQSFANLVEHAPLVAVLAWPTGDEKQWRSAIDVARSQSDFQPEFHSEFDPLPSLKPREPDLGWFSPTLSSIGDDELTAGKAEAHAATIRAGLLQIHDFLDESHEYSQTGEGARTADYWHGIMHRREPDYSNAKYWFRRVGAHPIFDSVAAYASSFGRSKFASREWDPFGYIDFCREARDRTDVEFAEQVQLFEMFELLAYSCGA